MEYSIDKNLIKEIKDIRNKFKATKDYTPLLYMLARDKKNVINYMYKVNTIDVGCYEMKRAESSSLHAAYYKASRAQRIPCGYISFTKKYIVSRTFAHRFKRNEVFLYVMVPTGEVRKYIPNNKGRTLYVFDL